MCRGQRCALAQAEAWRAQGDHGVDLAVQVVRHLFDRVVALQQAAATPPAGEASGSGNGVAEPPAERAALLIRACAEVGAREWSAATACRS